MSTSAGPSGHQRGTAGRAVRPKVTGSSPGTDSGGASAVNRSDTRHFCPRRRRTVWGVVQFAGGSFGLDADRVWASGPVRREELAGHPRLAMVVLSDGLSTGAFTEAALAELQRRLPACEIVVVGRGTFPDL